AWDAFGRCLVQQRFWDDCGWSGWNVLHPDSDCRNTARCHWRGGSDGSAARRGLDQGAPRRGFCLSDLPDWYGDGISFQPRDHRRVSRECALIKPLRLFESAIFLYRAVDVLNELSAVYGQRTDTVDQMVVAKLTPDFE